MRYIIVPDFIRIIVLQIYNYPQFNFEAFKIKCDIETTDLKNVQIIELMFVPNWA